MADDLHKTLVELEQAHGVIQGVAANPAVSERITNIARLLSRRAMAGNFNCVCGSASHAGQLGER
jgi:hypothetical protein